MSLVDQTIAWLTNPLHWSGPNGIPIRLLEHLEISGASFVIAVAIALPIGLAVGHTGRGATFAVNLANLGRAVPSLAVIGLLVPFTQAIDPQLGFTFYPTLIGLDRLLEAQLLAAPAERRHDLELVKGLVGQHIKRLGLYRCEQCGFRAKQYYWRCPGCQKWETYAPRRTEAPDGYL